jgi:hypothetical protein
VKGDVLNGDEHFSCRRAVEKAQFMVHGKYRELSQKRMHVFLFVPVFSL